MYKDERIVLDEKRLWDDIANSQASMMNRPNDALIGIERNDGILPAESDALSDDNDTLQQVPVLETAMMDKTIVFAPGEKNSPLGLFVDEFAECKTFINLFGGKLIDCPKGMSYQNWWLRSQICRKCYIRVLHVREIANSKTETQHEFLFSKKTVW